jgi:hypothetical protein
MGFQAIIQFVLVCSLRVQKGQLDRFWPVAEMPAGGRGGTPGKPLDQLALELGPCGVVVSAHVSRSDRKPAPWAAIRREVPYFMGAILHRKSPK